MLALSPSAQRPSTSKKLPETFVTASSLRLPGIRKLKRSLSVIQRMIRERERSMQGELRCENRDTAILHADVDYSVAITYV